MKYKVAVEGYAVIEVEADSSDDAEDKVSQEMPGVSGELSNMEVLEAVPVDDAFELYTDLN